MQTKFNEMVLTLKKPGQDIIDSWTPAKASAAHMLTGLLDEFFELAEAAIEMYSFYSEGNRKNVREEAGDLLFYIEGLAQDLNLPKIPLVKAELETLPSSLTVMLNIITPVKRHLYYNKELDVVTLVAALENLASTTLLTAFDAGYELDEVLEANMVKLLKGRYKSGYSDEAANKREDKTEA